MLRRVPSLVAKLRNRAIIASMEPEDRPKPPRDAQGRFPKGVSGNPGGRSSGTAALTHAYRDVLETACPDDPKHRTYAELIAQKMVQLAIKGDISAAIEISDRVEGKARQSVSVMNDPYAQMSDEELAAELERLESVH